MDEQFFGNQPGMPPYEEQPGDVDLAKTEKIGQTFGWVLTTEDLPELIDDQIMTKRLRDDRPDLTAMTDRELADRYFSLMDAHFRDLFAHHIFVSYMVFLPIGILSAMAEAVGDPSLMMRLIGGLGEVDSAAPSMMMWDMGRVVAESPTLMAEFDRGLDGLHDRVKSSTDESAVKLCAMSRRVHVPLRVARPERVGDAISDVGDATRPRARGGRPDAALAARSGARRAELAHGDRPRGPRGPAHRSPRR